MESINSLAQFTGINPFWIALIIIWALAWKGLALWRAAGLQHKWWFIGMLVLNTLGILEIIYLFLVAKNYKLEIVEESQ